MEESIKAYFIGGELDLSIKLIHPNLKRYMTQVPEFAVGVHLKNGDEFSTKMKVQEYRLTRIIERAEPARNIHVFEWVGLV